MQTDTTLKSYFEAGDTPTEAQFGELIDSKRHNWTDYAYLGIAVTTTIPTVTDRNVFYFATQAGTYTNINSLVVNRGEFAVLKFTVSPSTGIGVWSKDVVYRANDIDVFARCEGLAFLQPGLDDSGDTEPAAISLKCENNATGAVTYQWQSKSAVADDWANITGETAQTLTFDNSSTIWNSHLYVMVRCLVTDGASQVYTSNAVTCYTTSPGGEQN